MVYSIPSGDDSVPSCSVNPWHKGAFIGAVEGFIFDRAEELFGPGSPILETMRYHCSGGKRLRALLPAFVARHYGAQPQEILPFAAACEVLHNATLVHDDLEDGDELRRGQLSVWRRFGEARAINLGDALIILAYALLDDLSFAAERKLKAMRRMTQVSARSIDGQEREFVARELPPEEVTVERVLQIAEGKTSALFALPLVASAELCGASEHELSQLERSAHHLGVHFQIQDDLLDFLGHKSGRFPKSDLMEGKRSILVALACEHVPKERAQALLDFLDLPDEQKTTKQLNAYGAMLGELLPDAFQLLEQRQELLLLHLDGALSRLIRELLSLLTHAELVRK